MDEASSKRIFFFSFNSFHLMRLYNVTFLKDIFLCAFLFLCCFHLCSIFVLSRLVLSCIVIVIFLSFCFQFWQKLRIFVCFSRFKVDLDQRTKIFFCPESVLIGYSILLIFSIIKQIN
jgi:hypothetical protein